MHLSLSLESLCKCMFLCSIFFSLHYQSGGTVRVMFTLSSSFCCVYMYSVHFLLFQFHILFFVYFPPVWTKAPSALFLKGILPVSDCMCLMHFGSLSPLPPTQYLTASLSGLKQTHFFSPSLAFLHSSHQLFNKCHKQHEKRCTVRCTVRRQPARRAYAIFPCFIYLFILILTSHASCVEGN